MELNELTKVILTAGYSPDETPPWCREYNKFYGGWTYHYKIAYSLVFETPCGLLYKFNTLGIYSYQGVNWMLENNNPVVCCPKFDNGNCLLKNPLLKTNNLSSSSGTIRMCACHLANKPYDYENSLDKAHDLVDQEADSLFEEFKLAKSGKVCKHHSTYNRTEKRWRMHFYPLTCGDWCTYCDVLGKELNRKKGNVFYDLKTTRTKPAEGLFPSETVVHITKGIKFLNETKSLDICAIIAKCGKHLIYNHERSKLHRDLFTDKSFAFKILNIRAVRVDKRDMLQDLQDVANGITVNHKSDLLKVSKEQKRARKQARIKQKINKYEKLILRIGFNNLPDLAQISCIKWLGEERIEEIEFVRRAERSSNTFEQLTLV